MQVSEIWRYPVKSMQGESVPSTMVGADGIVGDRGWALFDAESGLHLTGRRDPDMLFALARLVEGSSPEEPEVVVTLPDGTETNDDDTLSRWLGRAVELRRAGRTSIGTYEIQLDESDENSWVQWTGPEGSFHDSTRGKISLGSIQSFGSWDRRRFRTNLILDSPGDVDLVGTDVTIGSTRLNVTKPIDRCVMVTRPQPPLGDLPAIEQDLDVLKTINAEYERCLTVGAVVEVPGEISVGDTLG